jgi:hypothetical protein
MCLNSVIESLDGRNPCKVVDERTSRNSRGVTIVKETGKCQWTFIKGHKKVALIPCCDLCINLKYNYNNSESKR